MKDPNMQTENNISVDNKPSYKPTTAVELLSRLDINDLSDNNIESKLDNAVNLIVEYLCAEHGYITLSNKDGVLETSGSTFEITDDSLSTQSDALVEKVIETGKAIIVRNAMSNKLFEGDPSFQRFNIATALCVPVIKGQSAAGVIYIDSTGDCALLDEDIELLEFIGEYVGLAISTVENRRLIDAGKATLNLSHSVKNILQMVGGAAEVIDFGLKSNEIHRVKRSWDILMPNLERLRKFMLDMLDYSKDRNLETGPCEFNRVIQGAIESLKSQLKQKQSKLKINIDRNIPIIELDEERIHEMSLNLILNAIDIVDKSSGVVIVETKYHIAQSEVELSVADNGPGMTDEIKNKIFTPFESGKNKFGTGLGMAIAKQITDQHNGRIEIESELGKGATFRVFLPAKLIEE